MMRSWKITVPAITLIAFGAFACVTINIYFPAEKVESVAGEIVKDIRGAKPGNETLPETKEKDSFLHQIRVALLTPSDAWAQDVTGVSNPTIRALKSRMKSRYSRMKSYYQKGTLKEGNNGYVSIANTKGLGLKEKRDLRALVDAENRDRRKLYEEVAKALKIDLSQVNKVAEIFAKEWQRTLK
ncbi:MAG: DUF1318 domain-containing protein [Deltaproteobacteria bacterium]|nr:DUF1318 domain-containing protein [Deltaproteobacteria bacterium]MBW2137248.1 DUF1318 domain-containing protein [Deltaproteobacteria bacterium]